MSVQPVTIARFSPLAHSAFRRFTLSQNTLRKQNKEERKGQISLNFAGRVESDIRELDEAYQRFEKMPERSAADYYTRRTEYEKFRDNIRLRNLRLLADAQVAQFYLPKTPENRGKHVTHDTFSRWMEGLNPTGPGIAAAMTLAHRKRFGHWFIEFWDVVDAGGFDLIIGNPPYLGGKKLSDTYGYSFCEFCAWEFFPSGLSDLVVFFLRRSIDLVRRNGYVSFITTNSIKDGAIRRDGLDNVIANGCELAMAVRAVKWPGTANLTVSLLSVCKGQHGNSRFLDGKPVSYISTLFEETKDAGDPIELSEMQGRAYVGSVLKGDGFIATSDEARLLIEADSRNAQVVQPLLNGDDINSIPDQRPWRNVVCFRDFPESKAQTFEAPYLHVTTRAKPERLAYDEKKNSENRKLKEKWWLFGRWSSDLYSRVETLRRCFVAAIVTKHLNFSAAPTNVVFTNKLFAVATESWAIFAALQSTIHEAWARKFSGTLETRLNYSPTDCFFNFPFPRNSASESALAAIGETYHEHRRALMRDLWLGLTNLYNLFHDPALTPELVTESLGERATITGDEGFARIQRLRELHRELDQTVLIAYGWHTDSDFGPTLALGHDFHPLDFLPENDRIRLTVHPESRREVLARLLKLNHQRAAEQERTALPKSTSKSKRELANSAAPQPSLLPPAQRDFFEDTP